MNHENFSFPIGESSSRVENLSTFFKNQWKNLTGVYFTFQISRQGFHELLGIIVWTLQKHQKTMHFHLEFLVILSRSTLLAVFIQEQQRRP